MAGAQPHFAFAQMNVMWRRTIQRADANCNVPFELKKQFFRWVDVVVVPRVRAHGHKHDHVVRPFVELLVHYGSLKLVAMIVNPFHQVEWLLDFHVIPHLNWYMARMKQGLLIPDPF